MVNDGIIEKKVLIQASPEIVFEALTNAKDLVRWFCDRAASDPRVGGEFKATWRAGRSFRKGLAFYTQLDPARTVELTWEVEAGADSGAIGVHTLRYSIRPRKDGCEVTMCDAGNPPPDDEVYAALDHGWIGILRDFKEHCEARERAARKRLSRNAAP